MNPDDTDAPYRPSTGEKARWFRQALRDLGVRGFFRASRAARKAERNVDLDADSPEYVGLDEPSYAVLQRALDLAADEREDDEAVEDLRRMASRRRRTLQVAALGARQRGAHRDYEVRNRAHRLRVRDHQAVSGTSTPWRARHERSGPERSGLTGTCPLPEQPSNGDGRSRDEPPE